jgi:hypothetical protein
MHRRQGLIAGAGLVLAGFASSLLLAGCGGGQAGGKLSTALSTASVSLPAAATVTEQAPAQAPSTVTQVATVTAPPPVTATVAPAPASSGDLSPWVWVVLGGGAVVVIILLVRLFRRRPDLSVDERERRLFAAVSGWTTRGWTIDQQSADSAMLSRDGEHVRLTVDGRGDVASSRLVPG